MNTPPQQGAVHRPPLLDTKRIVKLTDLVSELFRASYDLERMHKQAAKARLAAELAAVDLFGSTSHYANEDYVPDGGQR